MSAFEINIPMETILKVGACYKRIKDNKLFRILEIDSEGNSVWVCRIMSQTTRVRRLWLSDLRKANEAGRLLPVVIVEDPPPAAEFRTPAQKAAFEMIQPGLQEMMSLGYPALAEKPLSSTIAEKAAAAGVKPAAFNVAFSKVLMAGGVIDAAVPRWHKSGRWASSGNGDCRGTNQPNSYPLAVVDIHNITEGVRSFLRDGASWNDAYEAFIKQFYPSHEKHVAGEVIIVPKPAHKRPSIHQFRYHGIKTVPFEERMRLMWGDNYVDTNMRGCPTGQSITAIYPGFVWEIDWTWSDNVAVAKGSRLAIGRLTIYGIADPFDGYIYGMYACLGNACVAEAGQAIRQASEDKVALLAQYGEVIEPWMWRGGVLPARFRVDQGELDSWKSSGLSTSLGVQLEICPARRGDLKGTIESIFNQVSDELRKLDGATSGRKERLKDHPNVTAIFDLDQLQRLLFLKVIEFNHRVRVRQAMTPGMVADKVPAVPARIQEWAIEGGLYRDVDPVRIQLGTLPSRHATVTKQGIRIEGLTYKVPTYAGDSYSSIEPNDWLMRARAESWEVEVAQVPSTVNYILLRHRPPGSPLVELKCELADEHEGSFDLTWGMYRQIKDIAKDKQQEYKEGDKRDVSSFVEKRFQEIIATASVSTKDAREGLNKNSQITGVDERRAIEAAVRSPAESTATRRDGQPNDFSANRADWEDDINRKTA